MLDTKRIMEIHNRREAIEEERRQMLAKYGYVPAQEKVLNKDRYFKAFQTLCNRSITAWPRESADPEAMRDYNWYIDSEIEMTALSFEMKDIYRRAQEEDVAV